MMRQEYLDRMNYMANQQKIPKKGCGCGGNVKKTTPHQAPPTVYNPMKPQPFKR